MLHFKVTRQERTLSKHVQFQSEFGKYEIKGSADLSKSGEATKYYPVAARLTVYEKNTKGTHYIGKVRVRGFDKDKKPMEVIPDLPERGPFSKEDLQDLLDTALNQLHLV